MLKCAEWIKAACKADGVIVFDDQGNPITKSLIEPIEEERDVIEGSSLDLTVDKVFVIDDGVYIDPDAGIPYFGQIAMSNPIWCRIIPFIGVFSRITPKHIEIFPRNNTKVIYEEDGKIKSRIEKDVWELFPRSEYILQTKETVNIPLNIAAKLDLKTSPIRCFVGGDAVWVHPNYQGKLEFMISTSNYPFMLQRGARFVSLHFLQFNLDTTVIQSILESKSIAKKTHGYNGVWQGDRTSTNGQLERPY
jgi:deoxycytidine triphosphate deaminase